jgi:hypothetical protein
MADIETTPPATPTTTDVQGTPQTVEDFFEVVVGKDNLGNNISKKLSRDEAIKYSAIGLSANEKFEAAKTIQEQMKTLATALKDPAQVFQVLTQLGHNPDKLMQDFFQKQIEDAAMDPRDKELRKATAELEELRAKEKARNNEIERVQVAEKIQQLTKDFEEKIGSALTGAKLANNPQNRALVANYLNGFVGRKDSSGKEIDPLQLPMGDIVKHLRDNNVGSFKTMVEDLDDDAILELIDEKTLNRLGKALSKKLAKAQGSVDNTVNNKKEDEVTRKKDGKVMTTAEMEKEIQENIRKADAAWRKSRGLQ